MIFPNTFAVCYQPGSALEYTNFRFVLFLFTGLVHSGAFPNFICQIVCYLNCKEACVNILKFLSGKIFNFRSLSWAG